jgi:hypothetical protein
MGTRGSGRTKGKPKNSGNLSPASKSFLTRVSNITGIPLDVVTQISVAFPLAAAQLLLEDGQVKTGTCNLSLKVPKQTIALNYGPWIDIFIHKDIVAILKDDPDNLLAPEHLALLQEYRKKIDLVRIPNPNQHFLKPRQKKVIDDG